MSPVLVSVVSGYLGALPRGDEALVLGPMQVPIRTSGISGALPAAVRIGPLPAELGVRALLSKLEQQVLAEIADQVDDHVAPGEMPRSVGACELVVIPAGDDGLERQCPGDRLQDREI